MRGQGRTPAATAHAGAFVTGRSLAALFDPSSIAVVGASDNPTKWGHKLSRRALESSGDRPVLLVNHHGGGVLGRTTHRSLAEAQAHREGVLDLAVLCVPAPSLVAAVRDAVAAGVRAIVVITAGLAELGEPGARLQREVVQLAHSAGVVLVGPNCLGVVDTTTRLQLSLDVLPAGEVTVLSQSGNLVLDLASLLVDRGLGIARFVSLGNQADLGLVELMNSCLDHAGTRAVAIYAEDLVDGRAFITAARALSRAGKPVVLLAPGRSEAAMRSAVSHTGSLTSASAVIDAACAAGGIRRVDNPTQLADLLQGLLGDRRMVGRDVAILTDGGGHGAVAADALASVGLSTPVLEPDTCAVLQGQLWANSTVANPVDLAGAGEQDPMTYARSLETLLAADEVDGVLLTGYFGGYSVEASPELPGSEPPEAGSSGLGPREVEAARVIISAVAALEKPLVVHSFYPWGPTGDVLREAGIPVHRDIDRACAVLAGLVEASPTPDDLVLPAAAPALQDTSYDAARRLFADAGVVFADARTVRDAVELEEALEAPGLVYPLVLKALGRLHKSEDGGVVLGLDDADVVRSTYTAMLARLDPPAVSVETMLDTTHGVEVIAGCVRDPRFGPVLMVGLGGVFSEVLGDLAYAIAPASPETVRGLLLSLRAAPLLLGARGRDPIDLDSLATTISGVSSVAAAHPELAELELNPILATKAGAVALDARVVAGPEG